MCVCVCITLCSVVLTHAVAPLSPTLFHRLHRRHLSRLFCRPGSGLAPLSGCRRGDTGHDPRWVVITCRLMVPLPTRTISKGNNAVNVSLSNRHHILLPSNGQHLNSDGCLEDKREDYRQNCSVLFCVLQL